MSTATHRAPGLHIMSSPMEENARRVLQQGLPDRAKELRELTESFEADRKKVLSTDSPASRDIEAQLQPELELLHAALPPRQPRPPPPLSAGGTPDDADACAKRIENIRRQIAEDPLPAHEALAVIEGSTHGAPAEIEDAAVVRAYRGYEVFGDLNNSYKEWYTALKHLRADVPDFTAALENDPTLPSLTEERFESLIEADRLIVEHEASTVVFSSANRMYLVLKCIQFAFAWNTIPPPKQDKAKKALYVSKDDNLHFSGLSLDEAIAEVDSKYLQLYIQWNRKYTRLNVTPRIKLGKIYKTTGLHILLDPFWVPDNLIEERPTADLNSILENLRKDAPRDTEGTDLLVARFNGNHGAALALAHIVDGDVFNFMRHVNKTCLTDAAVARTTMADSQA
ncbi:hypothetical protein B0H14DRAFT_2994903 [Mycena olivaceomarginata]|nr:hypothetical protein B0H14DRAFT_2994903 [Mycena olivaceomarginata]